MGETIRCLMVAVAALVWIIACDSTESAAQGPGFGYELPDSLRGSLTDSVDAVQSKSRAALVPPPPAGGVADYRAIPRSGGPTTDPTSVRDSSWLTDNSALSGSRPTTAPFGQTVSPPASSGSTLVDQLRSGQRNSVIATVAATQEMQSREAQTMTLPPRSTNSAAAPASGFGSLPTGIDLPPRTGFGASTQTSTSGATFGSEFGVGATAWPQGQPTSATVFGPQTAQEANFDASLYNTNTRTNGFGAPPLTASTTSAPAAAQREVLPPGNYGRSTATNTNFGAGSSLGMPATDPSLPSSVAPTLPSDWTYEQIAELGRMFGYAPSDPRMGDKVFVNNLYAKYREYQMSDALRNTATGALGGNSVATGNWPPGATTAGAASPNASALGGAGNLDPRLANRSGSFLGTTGLPGYDSATTLTDRTDVDPRLSKKDVEGLPPGAWSYDSYGNPIDKDRYVLDRFGQRVDEETQFELTIGRKRRQQEELAAKQAAERSSSSFASNSSIAAPSSSDRFASTRNSSSNLPTRPGSNDTATVIDRSGTTGDDLQSPFGRIPTVDQAGIGGTAKAIGKSNPYVNIFLLCSLVANVFLFASLHRLWYHHRDLIASSRIATSGISAND